ncbi:MAG: polymer-forming cytoskeletal protein [Patescibacteria group bacterium]|jgi:cytoskeletal protein CcmA (bactofilin family)
MFNKQEAKNAIPDGSKDAETIIGPSVTVKGNLNSDGNIIIEGVLEGGVKTAGEVFVGNKAQITANIEAKNSHIGGEVRGNLKIEERLALLASAKIFGDIECSSLSVEAGAIINGKCTMTKDYKSVKNKEEKELEVEEEKV